jgi:hypothetical protein
MAELALLDAGVVDYLATLPKPTTNEEAKQVGTQFASWVRSRTTALALPWPEDDWFCLGEAWDINLYLDMDDKPAATLFPVVDGKTQTDVFLAVKVA